MSEQVVTIAEIQRRARAAFARGLPLSACPMHPWTDAYKTWAAEYARLAKSQQSHAAPSERARVDLEQTA